MKKFAPLLVAVFMMLGGLIAVSPAANAAYPGTIPTNCGIGKVKSGSVNVNVTADGTAEPTGLLKVVVRGHHKKFVKYVQYQGTTKHVRFTKKMKRLIARPGHEKIRVVFVPGNPQTSVYRDCTRTKTA